VLGMRTDDPKVRGNEQQPLVSAVIPTTGRDSLISAVESALAQSWANIEVIISVDGSQQLIDHLALPDDPRIRIITSDEPVGAQKARSRGVAASGGEFIALLDDDDRWLPGKVAHQVQLASQLLEKGAPHALIACRMSVVRPNGQVVRTSPQRLPPAGESLAAYLFIRREVPPDGAAICSSMLLFDRGLAQSVPLGESSPIHDDWNWVLSVDRGHAADIRYCPEILLAYTQNAPGVSASSSATWTASLNWFESQRTYLSRREFADAILCHSAPLAIRRRDWHGVRKLLSISVRDGRPGPKALIFTALMCARELLRVRSSADPTRSDPKSPDMLSQGKASGSPDWSRISSAIERPDT
jgi:glycosyltransferase involved in cell wall biosynthesis